MTTKPFKLGSAIHFLSLLEAQIEISSYKKKKMYDANSWDQQVQRIFHSNNLASMVSKTGSILLLVVLTVIAVVVLTWVDC